MRKTTFTRRPKKSVRISEAPQDGLATQTTATEAEDRTGAEFIPLPGTRVSLFGGKTVVSTGHAFIDGAFGSGIGLGEMALVVEDVNTTYAEVLLQLFLAQGLALPEAQKCIVLSPDGEVTNSLLPLPKPLHLHMRSKGDDTAEAPSGEAKLKIAWRYQDVKGKADAAGTKRAPFSDTFDLHKRMEMNEKERGALSFWRLVREDANRVTMPSYYAALLQRIKNAVDECTR